MNSLSEKWSARNADASTFYSDERTKALGVQLRIGGKTIPAILHIVPESGQALIYCEGEGLGMLSNAVFNAVGDPKDESLYRINEEVKIAARQHYGTLFLYNNDEPGLSPYSPPVCSRIVYSYSKDKVARDFACKLRKIGISMLPSINNK